MKKNKKKIIILAAVLAVLVAVMVVLFVTAPETEDKGSTTSTAESIQVLSKQDVTVTNIDIKNPYSEYEIVITEKENEDGSITTLYEVPGYEGVNFKNTNFASAANTLV